MVWAAAIGAMASNASNATALARVLIVPPAAINNECGRADCNFCNSCREGDAALEDLQPPRTLIALPHPQLPNRSCFPLWLCCCSRSGHRQGGANDRQNDRR